MRTLVGTERTRLQAPRGFWGFSYLEVTNYDGTWINLGALAVGARTLNLFNTITWSDSIDANTLSMTATMKREIGAYSLSPFRSDSPVNVDGAGAYQPLLDLHRKWRLKGVFLPRGTYPLTTDYREYARGWVDRIDIQGEPATITVQGRGMEADLIDRRIMFVDATATPLVPITSDTPKVYAGGAIGTVLQAILDDALGAGAVTLTLAPSAPSFYVNGWNQQTDVGLFDLLTQIAGLAGASLRYKYDASDVLTLTLYTVTRNPSNADWQCDADEYEKLDAGIGNANIRNFVAVRYVDTNFGLQAVTSPVVPPNPPTSASIARYGLRPLGIDLSADTQVTSQTAAGNLADAIRADLEFPLIEQQMTGTGLWFGELGDYVKLLANSAHYNEDQYGGISSYSQTFQNGELTSTFGLSGKPKGRYLTWLDFGPGAPRTPYTPVITELTATAFEAVAGLIRFSGVSAVATVNQYTRSVTFELSATVDFAVVLGTGSVDVTTGAAGYVFTAGVSVDTIYYVRATPFSGPLVTGTPAGVEGEPVITSTYVKRLSPTQAEFDTIVDTIGDLAGTVGAIGIPTVFVNVTEDDQWLALSTIPTSETEVGTEYRRQRYLVGAGSVRLNANIKTLTGTPTVKLKYSVNAFGAVADLVTWTPAGTGLRTSAWVALPTAAKADAGLTIYVADGADTAALDLYELDAEFLPTIVAGGRVHVEAFAADFY